MRGLDQLHRSALNRPAITRLDRGRFRRRATLTTFRVNDETPGEFRRDAGITIRYATSRGELWRSYWRAWAQPSGTWLNHAFIAANVFLLVYMFTRYSPDAVVIAVTMGVVAFPLAMLGFALWPQLRFRSVPRTLHVSDQGILSEVGGRQGSKSWSEIRGINARDDAVYVEAADGSALVVPDRAFATPEQFQAFVIQVRQWYSEGSSSQSGTAHA